ncbi:MAG TPA: hypothetical protein VM010_05865 [Chitinophagaceae bacterium]|nr:hypothetical protein [Chitinophagaceae bacterium]
MQENNKGDRPQTETKAPDTIPDKTTTKPMDSKQDVEKANDPKIEQDFPGYPHYPAKEDIMDTRTGDHRVDMDVENLPNSKNTTAVSQRFTSGETRDDANAPPPVQPTDGDDYSDINPRTEKTSAGLETLGSTNAEIGIPQNADNDDLNKRTAGTDLDDEDLDFSRSTEADVTPEERATLENISMPTGDDANLRRAALDTTDFDGEQLNEDSFGEVLSSTDLDIPDETDETRTSAMGQGDEENKYYSLGGDRHESQEEDPQSGPARDND